MAAHPFDRDEPGSARSALGPVVAAGLLHLLLLVTYLIPFRGDLSALVCAPHQEIGKPPYSAVTVGFPTHGYDGCYYYVIAQNPFEPQVEYLDNVSMRRARLLYPLACWLLSGGDGQRLLWVMPLLNLIATLGTTWLGARFALQYRRSAWWGLLLPIGVNVLLPSWRNLTDPLATMAIVGLLVTWRLQWPIWTLLGWGIASVLSREQNIAIVFLVFGEALLDRDRRRSAAMAIAVTAGLAWVLILRSMYGMLPSAPQNLSPPFVGIWYGWTHVGSGLQGPRNPIPHSVRMFVLSCQTLLCLTILPRGFRTAGLLGLGAAALVFVGGIALFEDAWSYMRVLNWVPLAVWMWTIESGRRWPVWLLLPAVLWPCIELAKWWH
jgi:hypothetical protein